MKRATALLLLLACNQAPPAPAAPAGPTLPAKLYVHGSTANLREMPDDKSTVVERLSIGSEVLVSELGAVWARVSTATAAGFVARDVLGAERPTLEWALAKHDALPLDDVQGRRSWAERSAALAPEDIGALERLIEALDRAGDKKAHERAKRGLAGVHEALEAKALGGIVVQPDSAARALPTVDSDLIEKLGVGDVVYVLRESEGTSPVFVAVIVKGKKAWMQLDALAVPEIHHLYENFVEGTDTSAAWSAAPQAGMLWRAETLDKVAAASDAKVRRRAVTSILAGVKREVGEMTGTGFNCETVADVWKTFQKDADPNVRRAATDGVLALEGDPQTCILGHPSMREALAARVKTLPPKIPKEEREGLASLLALAQAIHTDAVLDGLSVTP
jgi:hypothetical protein